MLDPNVRSLYVDALRPPAGMVLDRAIAATYSLDLSTLLTVPISLTLFGPDRSSDLLRDGVLLLEALRRASRRITVYCQQGAIHIPEVKHLLYGLLEPIVVEVRAPRGGIFHPKLWVLRFTDPQDPTAIRLRLLVLSRNLTGDRSWDVSLILDGRPTGRYRSENRELGELIAALPTLAPRSVPEALIEQATTLGDEVRRTEWELPAGYETAAFRVLGLKGGRWLPGRSKRLVVVSPFLTDRALEALAETTNTSVALISRPDELQKLDPASLPRFDQVFMLHEAAEQEDGEDVSETATVLRGIHAKLYISESGFETTIALGSANATTQALLAGQNVELVAELTGKRSQIGGIDTLLGEDGLKDYLLPFQPDQEAKPDPLVFAAEKALETAREALVKADLSIECSGSADQWRLALKPNGPVALAGVSAIRARLTTVADGSDATGLSRGEAVALPTCALASITSFIALELRASAADVALGFVLNVPVRGLPETRDAAVLRAIISNSDSFLRYLLLLLAQWDELSVPDMVATGTEGFFGSTGTLVADAPLLEQIARALSRDPARLRSIGDLVQELLKTPEGRELVPPAFLEMWRVVERVMEGGAW